MGILLHISTLQVVNIVLVLALLFLVYRYFESTWSYKISKPFAWEEAMKKGEVSKGLVKLERNYRDRVRFYNFWFQIKELDKQNVQGAFAELGVHQGETAKIIHQMAPERKLYLFDTFEGFSKSDLDQEDQNDERFSPTMFSDTSVNEVAQYIGGNSNITFKAGLFPETTAGLENEQFAFVNIDADLYAPTLEALRFFYPRLSAQGALIIHDYYHNWDGVKKAVDEFMPTIPESLIAIPDWQGSVMIVKNG